MEGEAKAPEPAGGPLTEEQQEREAYKGCVRPGRLKFSIKPRLPKAEWWRPRHKLSFVVSHERCTLALGWWCCGEHEHAPTVSMCLSCFGER